MTFVLVMQHTNHSAVTTSHTELTTSARIVQQPVHYHTDGPCLDIRWHLNKQGINRSTEYVANNYKLCENNVQAAIWVYFAHEARIDYQ